VVLYAINNKMLESSFPYARWNDIKRRKNWKRCKEIEDE
jgi:hypothetical protein